MSKGSAKKYTHGKRTKGANGRLLTTEQQAILATKGSIRINAVAGAGKTTTLIEYARSRPEGSRILYLAFNKSVKLEAIEKFRLHGLNHVTVETAHSLAYKHIVFKHGYEVRTQSYKNHEVATILGLRGSGEKHSEFVFANHINRLTACFCNSDKARVQEINYLSTITDKNTKNFVRSHYHTIETGARQLLAKMDKGAIAITHDFYLKKFQLEQPDLPYDYILFDEGQDASGAMLQVFLKQKATRVIVGDTHQQIYSWRFAINSLETADFPSYTLNTSFRFPSSIARLAMNILSWKELLTQQQTAAITGEGVVKALQSRATIARTNLGLLSKAIAYVSNPMLRGPLHFEGHLNSYLYAEEGASLYDVLNLSTGNRQGVRDALLSSMQDMGELEQYIANTEDPSLAMMVEMVKKYGTDLPRLIKLLKENHTDDRQKAAMIFSTVHRAKGMEYDSVELAEDFISEARLQRIIHSGDEYDKARLIEEINLLYVAITRCRSKLMIPEALLPKDFSPCTEIQVVQPSKEKESREVLPKDSYLAKRRLRKISPEEKEAYEMAYFFKKKQGKSRE